MATHSRGKQIWGIGSAVIGLLLQVSLVQAEATAETGSEHRSGHGVCIVNGTQERMFFVAQSDDGARET